MFLAISISYRILIRLWRVFCGTLRDTLGISFVLPIDSDVAATVLPHPAAAI